MFSTVEVGHGKSSSGFLRWARESLESAFSPSSLVESTAAECCRGRQSQDQQAEGRKSQGLELIKATNTDKPCQKEEFVLVVFVLQLFITPKVLDKGGLVLPSPQQSEEESKVLREVSGP